MGTSLSVMREMTPSGKVPPLLIETPSVTVAERTRCESVIGLAFEKSSSGPSTITSSSVVKRQPCVRRSVA